MTTSPRFRSATVPTETAGKGGGSANGHEGQNANKAPRDTPPTYSKVETVHQPQENVSPLMAIGAPARPSTSKHTAKQRSYIQTQNTV